MAVWLVGDNTHKGLVPAFLLLNKLLVLNSCYAQLKIGPNKAFAFKPPTPTAQKVIMESFNATSDKLAARLKTLKASETTFINTDFGTCDKTQIGSCGKVDKTYAELLDRIANDDFNQMPPELQNSFLNFYATATASTHHEATKD